MVRSHGEGGEEGIKAGGNEGDLQEGLPFFLVAGVRDDEGEGDGEEGFEGGELVCI